MIQNQLAEVSNLLIIVAIVVYVLALVGFSADLAAASQRRSDVRLGQKELAGVGAGRASAAPLPPSEAEAKTAAEEGAQTSSGTVSARSFGFAMSGVAVLLHLAGIVLRGVITERVPWANMYEFSMTGAAIVVIMFLAVAMRRPELRVLGTFVILPVLVVMLVAQTLWIVPAATLTPSLQNSHWLVIHVIIAVLSSGLFALGALVALLQLLSHKHEQIRLRRQAEIDPHVWGRAGAILEGLPGSKDLEALSYRIHAVAFVGWTFTLIFGAIWANQAWGRFWNWDPKEVWTFVIWVVYAAYLHARATRGFRGSKAAWFALAGFVCIIFNYTIVNTVINGLHSYSGL